MNENIEVSASLLSGHLCVPDDSHSDNPLSGLEHISQQHSPIMFA